MRSSNEVLIADGLVADILGHIMVHGFQNAEVISGPHPEAKVTGIRMEDGWVVLEYDREVPEVLLRGNYDAR